eukprot:TRINITY_DN748_c0_g1_i1.p1 TRINITY_DN748_c0_g1~~TRINITY_DN748_c0_g1_i1.p1  ORF type:complete len:252 (+),score=38.86 TRINITY_DN748_c0_g1_i1:1005-1760(+)
MKWEKDNDNDTVFLRRKNSVENFEGAFTISNVLNYSECEQIIEKTEKLGYLDAPLSTSGIQSQNSNARNNKRVMVNADNRFLSVIDSRIKKHLPKFISFEDQLWKLGNNKEFFGKSYNDVDIDEYETQIPFFHSLNDQLRFYKYNIGHVFKPHYDGFHPRTISCCSFFTFLIYLSDGFTGGETVFFKENNIKKEIKPEVGKGLLFLHQGPNSYCHSANPHTSETKNKYVLRSDIMYVQYDKDIIDEEILVL